MTPVVITSPRRPVPAPERPRHLEVVSGRSVPGRRPPLATIMVTVTVTSVALFALVTAQVMLGQAGFTQADLERRVDAKRIEVQQLQLDVARMRAPGSIAARAIALGMVPAGDYTVLLSVAPSPVGGRSPKRERP